MTTGWVSHELYMWHDPGRAATAAGDRRRIQPWEHYEHPETKLAVMEELSGVKTAVDDPMAPRAATAGGQELAPHQDEVIRRADRLASLG